MFYGGLSIVYFLACFCQSSLDASIETADAQVSFDLIPGSRTGLVIFPHELEHAKFTDLRNDTLKSSRLAESMFNRVGLSMRVTLYCPEVATVNGGINR